MRTRIAGAVALVVIAGLACSGSGAADPAPSPQALSPQAATVAPTPQPAGIGRTAAIEIAADATRPLFDNLRSHGQYNTVIRTETMSLGELAALAGDGVDFVDESALANTVWAVEIQITLIGTPAVLEPTYSVVGVDAEDGGLGLIATLQAPVLAGNKTP